jgi:hypothetical protein
MDNVNPDDYRMKFLEKDNLIDKPNVMKPVKGFEKAKASANKAKAETNSTVKDVEELGVVAKSTRGVQKMDATGTKMKKIIMKENSSLTKNDIIKIVHEIMAESGIDGGDNLIDDEQTSMY